MKTYMIKDYEISVYNHVTYIPYISMKDFLEIIPPCRDCLVHSMCIKRSPGIELGVYRYLTLQTCDELKNFLEGLDNEIS